ncbi:hypothetical protein M404DRAFT_28517 [Pisolithus tinctorius Marx 270]|uniref:Uncharacterized protein n=1 Tax=Pisolithus tinctorius Marx 270 TaxID=870435 RepID=A0A0C3NLE6_PISTI|nr:hypothetical protein M404DRAFT_28517 [Pisolithus tinctorius Marx 270]
MSSQRQSKTPQPTPGQVRNYSQVADEELVILTDDSTDTEREKSVEKACHREETERRERECEAERKAKREEAKRRKAEEERLEAEWRKRAEEEEEARRKKVAEEEAERQRQRQRASEERAQAKQNEAAQSVRCQHRPEGPWDLRGGHCDQKSPLHSLYSKSDGGAVRAGAGQDQGLRALPQQEEDVQLDTGRGGGRAFAEESRDGELLRGEEEEDAGGEGEEEPATPLEGPSGAGVHTQWVEWERERQLQAMERQAEAHETAALAFERMAEVAEQMAEAAEQTANEWALYRTWAEWAEMRRREDAREARVAEFERAGGGWKRPQSEAAEDQREEADEGAEGDNKEEVEGEQEGDEEQEGGGGQAMEE